MTWFGVCCLFLLGSVTFAEVTMRDFETRLRSINKKIDTAMRQMMVQQTFVEERIRSEGDSGIKESRLDSTGTKPYHSTTNNGIPRRLYSLPDQDRTLGINAPQVVMNGAEFRMKSEYIRLVMPSRTNTIYHSTQMIPLPLVPPQVLQKKTVGEQTKEMQEWFKAWKNSDYSKRDYRKYFKPVMCYLEGAWLNGNQQRDGSPLSPAFNHVQDVKRWEFATGSMPDYDKYSWLPSRIQEIANNTANFAKWDYRVLCHPISIDVHLNRINYVDDLAVRTANEWTVNQYIDSNIARFRLDPRNRGTLTREFFYNYGLLDTIMAEIPGKDNYKGNLKDDSFDLPAYGYKKGDPMLNTAFYHRWYKAQRSSDKRLFNRHRGYADSNLFMAQTSQKQVASTTYKDLCKRVGSKRECRDMTQRWTYTLPLAITYLTPLSSWNPYGIKVSSLFDYNTWNKVIRQDGKRYGGLTASTAWGQSSQKNFYLTPKEFYSDNTHHKGVLDTKGTLRQVRASGQNLVIRNIGGGVGNIRQTYPIFPVHGEGSTAWKELAALEDIVMDQKKYLKMFRLKA